MRTSELRNAVETSMQEATSPDRSDFDTFAGVIAHLQIVVAGPVRRLPAGFDDIDVAILDWIAAEGRRALLLAGGSHRSFQSRKN
jgi:hypothetical protein